jgi:hypothetical protein
MPVAMVTLAVLCLVLGIFAPWAVNTLFAPALGDSLEVEGAVESASTMLPITGLLLLGFLAALFVGFLGKMRTQRVRSVFVGGQAFDRNTNRFPGTEFYRTVQELPGIGPVMKAGESGAFDPYVAAKAGGRPFVRLLAWLHTGLVSHYVVWCLLGLGLLFAVLVLGR